MVSELPKYTSKKLPSAIYFTDKIEVSFTF